MWSPKASQRVFEQTDPSREKSESQPIENLLLALVWDLPISVNEIKSGVIIEHSPP